MDQEKGYFEICEELKKIIEETGELLEGNCVYKHLSFEKWDCLLNKRENYRTVAKQKNTICEIGFNAGHSILAMMLVNPTAHYVLFDLGTHKYSRPCFEYIKKRLPEVKMEIIWGDSRDTVPTYHSHNADAVFEVIHIDGSHKQEIYSLDWKNSLEMSKKGTFLVFDDTDNKKINLFIDTEIEKGIVKEADGFLETYGYQHRVLVRT